MKDFATHSTVAQLGLMDELRSQFPEKSILSDPKACSAYAVHAMADSGEVPRAVILAENIEDVQAALTICDRYDVVALPRGAGTNLTCAVSQSSEAVIICTSRMRGISGFDPVAGTIRVEAGVRNKAVSDHVADDGWYYAPDPSSRRNCTIGGNIATNSGGSSCLHSGVTVNHIAGLTVVLYDGTILELGGEAYDATGLDLASLMCGSEGQIGIVVEAVLRLSPTQPVRSALVIALDDPGQAQAVGADILASGVAPAQMDYMDAQATALCEAMTSVGYPDAKGGIILIDLTGSSGRLAEAHKSISRVADHNGATTKLYDSAQGAARIWQGRERIYGAAARVSRYVATDVAVPLLKMTDMLAAVESHVGAVGLSHATTAHLGDGTVHSFVFYDDNCKKDTAQSEHCATEIRKAAIKLGGTATSEYGIGAKHKHLLSEQFTEPDLYVRARSVDTLRRVAPTKLRRTDSVCESIIYTPETEHDAARILSDPTTGVFEVTGQSRAMKASGCSVLSAEALRGVVHHNPADQTVTVRAGTTLEELSRHLHAHSQRLTFDTSQAQGALTVGGAVALNLPTSRRPFSGSVRDAVLATRCVTGLGEVIATGARVLKNAAGLDLGKALAGSMGQLAFLTEVTLRIMPLSVHEQTGIFPNVSAQDFPGQVVRLMQAGWDITGAAHLSDQVAGGLGFALTSSMVLRVSSGFGRQGNQLGRPSILPNDRAAVLWETLSSGDVLATNEDVSIELISCKSSTGGAIAARLQDIGAPVVMDWRGALVWFGIDPSQDRSALRDILQDYADANFRRIPSSGETPAPFRVSRLKSALDPLGRFKPVRISSHFSI